MKNCPRCEKTLIPSDYEGFRVFRCDQCHGHLVPSVRVDSIKRLGVKPADDLKTEAADFKGDTPGTVRCPACRRHMERTVLGLPERDLSLDVCRLCALVWLDAGELALLQLGHEATDRFADAQDMKARAARLESSPARKAAFEENLASLPDRPNPIEEGIREAAEDALLRGSRRSFFDLIRLFWPLLWALALPVSQAFAGSPTPLQPENQKIRVCPSCGPVDQRSASRDDPASALASQLHANDISDQYKTWGAFVRSLKSKKP